METLAVAARVALSLGAVLAVIWFAQRRLTRRRPARREKDVVVVSRTGIGSKASVVSIEAEGRRFLLGVTDHSIQVIHSEAVAPRVEVPVIREPASAVGLVTGRHAPDDASTIDEFERLLAEAGDAGEPLLRPRARDNVPARGALAGSILSAATWKQTAAFIRQRR